MSQKIVFMGTPEFSIPTLELLISSKFDITAVYTQPPSKANRGQKTLPSSIEIFSKKKLLNVKTPKNLNNEEEFEYFKNLKPDLAVVVAYGKIIPKKFLDLPKFGFINLHASLLPKWRGAAPIQRSIMNLDTQTGVSIMKIVEKLDAGPVMHQEIIKINENIDTYTLSKVLSKLGAKSIINALQIIFKGQAVFIEQDHNKATYAKKITKQEGQINWNENANKIVAKINGLNPSPGAWFEFKGERIKIWKGIVTNKEGKPGEIIDSNLTIACSEKSIKIIEIQKEGKTRQTAEKFLLGSKLKQGEIIS